MSIEARDLRENTQELKKLRRVLEALNDNLVAVEKNKQIEKLPANLIPMCRVCAVHSKNE